MTQHGCSPGHWPSHPLKKAPDTSLAQHPLCQGIDTLSGMLGVAPLEQALTSPPTAPSSWLSPLGHFNRVKFLPLYLFSPP